MLQFMRVNFRFYASFSTSFRLFLIWILGLLLGTFSLMAADESFISLMRLAPSRQVSIVGLLISSFLPFLLCVCAVYIGKPSSLYLICFVKAFLFAQCSMALSLAFCSADWMIRILYQFTDLVSLPFFCWFCLRHISGSGALIRRDILVCSVVWLLVASIDFCVVSPFLAMLIDI